MFPNTAICAIFSGVALFGLIWQQASMKWGVRCAGSVTTIVASLTLCEHVFVWNIGIDTMLSSQTWGTRAATAPLRMGLSGNDFR